MCSNESPSTSYHPGGSVTGHSGDSTPPTSVAMGPHSGSGSGGGGGGGSAYETIQQPQVATGHHNNQRQTPSPVTTAAAAAAGMSAAMLTAASVSSGLLPPLDHYRLQLYNYAMAERLRCTQYPGPLQLCPSYPGGVNGPYGPRLALSMSLFHNRVFQPEEPKPQHSYIGLIAMAILSSPETKLVLSDIYQHILDNYPYFRSRGPGWRNSIRHNLSLNDCFVKAGRSANGKGHYWAIHPANLEDFKKGDFRRRKAQRKVRKHMGLAVDDEGTDSPSPPPLAVSPPPSLCTAAWGTSRSSSASAVTMYSHSRKRQFDVASLLAPDVDDTNATLFKGPTSKRLALTATAHSDLEEDIDVVTSDQEDRDDQLIERSSPLISISPIMDEDQINRPHSNSSQHHYNHHHHHHHHHNLNHHHHPQAMAAAAAAAAASTATATWQGLMQQWPSGFTPLTVGMDPRILGRYYGHYMAAHAAHATRRSAALLGPPADITEIITTTSSTGQTLQSNDC